VEEENKLRILFITLCSVEMNTSAMLRNKALIKGLVSNNAEIDLLTIPSMAENNYFDNNEHNIEGVNVIRLVENRIYTSLVKSDFSLMGKIKRMMLPLARKIYHSLNLFDNTILTAQRVERESLPTNYYDIIISSSDPKSSHIAARKLIMSGLEYGKWIQYWGDPFALDITRESLHPKFYVKNKERNILELADSIVYVSPFTLVEQQKLYSDFESKMCFIPIPYLEKKIYNEGKNNENSATLGYFGDYKSTVRDITPLYESIKANGQNLIVAGNSDLNLLSTKRISVYPRVSQEKILKFEIESDILVCVLNKSGTQIPGKIYHYAATNKPILVILDGEKKDQIRDYLSDFERFVLCENDEHSIMKAIDDILKVRKGYEPSPYFDSKVIAKQLLSS